MRFAELDAWGLRDSTIHRRDARAKLLATLLILLAASRGSLLFAVAGAAIALALARLPVFPVLLRAAVVLPFALSFSLTITLAGRIDVAVYALLRSYLSAVCVVVLIGCTPLPSILDGFRRLGAPLLLLETIQFVYRYLTLIGEQSRRMAMAATARGSRRSFRAVAGSVGVLFARSYDRAEAIHWAMLARGYSGSLAPGKPSSFDMGDVVLVLVSGAILVSSVLLPR